jgi:hypothetical protein
MDGSIVGSKNWIKVGKVEIEGNTISGELGDLLGRMDGTLDGFLVNIGGKFEDCEEEEIDGVIVGSSDG